MTEQQIPPGTGAHRQAQGTHTPMDLAPDVGMEGLTAWVRFGAVMMTIIGVFGIIEGLVALLTRTTYTTVNGTVLSIDLSAWGWMHLILGALLVITGVSLLREAPWARGVGALLAVLSILVQLTWMSAYPIWSILMVTIDVIVIYALVATRPDR
jgi:uncharacterized membrane protein HdeD (DUF308 family)